MITAAYRILTALICRLPLRAAVLRSIVAPRIGQFHVTIDTAIPLENPTRVVAAKVK